MVLGLIFSLIPTYGNLCRMLAFFVGMVFPTYESFKAIESKYPGDDTQWLMYWVCYAVLLSLEQVAWPFLVWIPFYRLVRVVALAWLALPQTRGASLLYESFVRPFLLVAVEKARELPALEPYVRDFMPVAKRKIEATFEKAKQQAAASGAEEEEEERPYQPLKAHAT